MVINVGRHHVDGARHVARIRRGIGVADGAQRQLVNAGRQIAAERDRVGSAARHRQTQTVPVAGVA